MSFLYRFEFWVRVRFLNTFFLGSAFILLILAVIQYLNPELYDFLPPKWSGAFGYYWIYILFLVPIILVMRGFLSIFERSIVRLRFKYLGLQEKEVLREFIKQDRMLGVTIDFQSKYVNRLVENGIITRI